MRTSRPAAWPALSFTQPRKNLAHMVSSCFCLFHNRGPANPLIASERRETVPFLEHVGIGSESFLDICRNGVDDAGSNRGFCHMHIIRKNVCLLYADTVLLWKSHKGECADGEGRGREMDCGKNPKWVEPF